MADERGPHPPSAVDELDTRILRLLLEQPRTSAREYARLLGIARGTLQARLDHMERDGVITGAAPSLSPAALGHPVLAFVHIEVTQGRLDEVGEALAAVPEIVEAFSITRRRSPADPRRGPRRAPGGRGAEADQPARRGAHPQRGGVASGATGCSRSWSQSGTRPRR
ncbi:hypothetical protein SVIOM342S_10032 [Streptomyces violaceorubidus]